MRERRVIGVAILLTVLVGVSLAFGLGVVDVSKLTSIPIQPASPGPTTVLVDPDKILDHTKQAGSYIEISINVSEVADLYAWQVNITWNPNTYGEEILNFTRIVSYGDFLARTASPNGTSRIHDIVDASNETGYAAIAESILGDYLGITGSGGLVTIEFNVVGYGSTDLTISLSGTLPTTLLGSTGGSITVLDTIDGYFRNKYPGDVDGDKYVGSADFSTLAGAYGLSLGDPGYNREADFDLDGYIGSADFSALAGNYGITFP